MWTSKQKCVKYCSIVGAHLVMAPSSFLWIYGNLSAYMDSYFQFACYPKCVDCDTQWILALYVAGCFPGGLLTKILVKRLGLKRTGVVAMVICGVALLGSAWVLQHSVAWTVVLYSVFLGQAVGVNFSVSYQIVGGWAPDKFALFMATVTSIPTMLSIIQNQLLTAYLNPENLDADAKVGPRTFFSQPEILNRVPMAVAVYGAMTFGLQLVGYILITNPQSPSSLETFSTSSCGCFFKNNETIKDTSDNLTCFDDLNKDSNAHKREINGLKKDNNNTTNGSKSYQSVPSIMHLEDDDATRNSVESEVTALPDSEDKPKSWKSAEAVKTPVFYALLLFGTSILYGLILKSNYYKQFALSYINDDEYLTLVGTLIPIISTISRIVFGTCLDKGLLSIKDAMILSLSLHTILSTFWYFAPQVNATLYLILILCLAGTQSVYYVLMPTAALRIYGPVHFSTNYGLLLSVNLIVGFLTPLAFTSLFHSLGWFWLFTSVSIASLVTLMFVIFTDFDI
ncbi:oxalate:formate antiporter-like isoform x1 [Plakobranchus ocellatus]|uniref:Oxalate:formate antiporter-like isoform x1 n=1 Tax=Plakobranchus ocellatus TaxID=259542 RepID=A0AAV3ZI12_9GAST|nr:oxalate:formate antiporter-like isoform x1 [Plakobranchus ocellatus]